LIKKSLENYKDESVFFSTGPYVVTWNFLRVKAGHLYDYQIKMYPQRVVADNFLFGQDNKIIVALPDDVTMVSKKNLRERPQAFMKSD
jgi:hypothetical protein